MADVVQQILWLDNQRRNKWCVEREADIETLRKISDDNAPGYDGLGCGSVRKRRKKARFDFIC